jgi:uncharacterized protein YraI
VALAAAALSGPVQAQPAFTATAVHLRAGPALDYPVVAVLPKGYQVAVQGCLSDYSWCDVFAGPERGWIYAAHIHHPYQNTHVPVLTYGAVIGVGVLTFVLNDYWPLYYRDRPWYADRHQWARRPVPPPNYAPHYPPRPPSGEYRPRPQLPTPPGFVGPGGQLNPPPAQGIRPGVWRPPNQYEHEPDRLRPPAPQRVMPGQARPGITPDGPSRGDRADGRADGRGDRQRDR